jgi:hypothetical protein
MLTSIVLGLLLAGAGANACPEPQPLCKDPRPVGNRDPMMLYPCLTDDTVRAVYEEKALAGEGQYDVRLWKYYVEDRRDNEKAMQWLILAAGRGHPDSQFTLGEILFERGGNSGARDEALSWMKKAAEVHASLAGSLGDFYRNTLHDQENALKWSRHGAMLGSEGALRDALKQMLQMSDVRLACRWYRAARQANLMEEDDKNFEARCQGLTVIADTSLVESLEGGARLRDDVRAQIARCFPAD